MQLGKTWKLLQKSGNFDVFQYKTGLSDFELVIWWVQDSDWLNVSLMQKHRILTFNWSKLYELQLISWVSRQNRYFYFCQSKSTNTQTWTCTQYKRLHTCRRIVGPPGNRLCLGISKVFQNEAKLQIQLAQQFGFNCIHARLNPPAAARRWLFTRSLECNQRRRGGALAARSLAASHAWSLLLDPPQERLNITGADFEQWREKN